MDSYVAKIQKHLDAIKDKNDKLISENQKLKQTIRELKSVNSRVRRIPKTPGQTPPAPAPPAEPVQ